MSFACSSCDGLGFVCVGSEIPPPLHDTLVLRHEWCHRCQGTGIYVSRMRSGLADPAPAFTIPNDPHLHRQRTSHLMGIRHADVDTPDTTHVPELERHAWNQMPKNGWRDLQLVRFDKTNLYQWWGKRGTIPGQNGWSIFAEGATEVFRIREIEVFTAVEAAERDLRRHQEHEGDFTVNPVNYPHLFGAFETISHDGGSGAGHARYYVPKEFADETKLRDWDVLLAELLKDEVIENYILGEEGEKQDWIGLQDEPRRGQLKELDAFLNNFFEDWDAHA